MAEHTKWISAWYYGYELMLNATWVIGSETNAVFFSNAFFIAFLWLKNWSFNVMTKIMYYRPFGFKRVAIPKPWFGNIIKLHRMPHKTPSHDHNKYQCVCYCCCIPFGFGYAVKEFITGNAIWRSSVCFYNFTIIFFQFIDCNQLHCVWGVFFRLISSVSAFFHELCGKKSQ